MKLHHIATFAILGVAIFLSVVNFLNGNNQIAAAYFGTAASWFVVASYEYNERVFDRAIRELARKYMAQETDDDN